MALTFGKANGKAIKNKVEAFEYREGESTVRLVGGILARYVYWLKGSNNKDIPVECLSFDRDLEKFTNEETDHVPTKFPDKKCQWAYSMNCIDPKDGRVKAINLKKKLFEQIQQAAENIGDPTDPDTGWDIVFKRAKTGPLPFNVEYTLNTFKLKVRPLTEEERAAVAAAPSIDTKYPRPTADEVLKTLEKITAGEDPDAEGPEADAAAKEAISELG